MYQKMKNLLFHTLVPAVLAVLMLSFPAYAAEAFCTVSIPVEIRLLGNRAPAGMEYEVILEQVTENAPMPEAASVIIKDGGQAAFGPITYTIPGDYQYRVRQKFEPRSNFTFDESSYLVTVSVVNTQDGGLAAVWTAEKDGGDSKSDGIVFTNRYTRPSDGNDDEDDDDDDTPPRVITDEKPGPGNDPFTSFTDPEVKDVIEIGTPETDTNEDPSLPHIPKLGDMGANGYLCGMLMALSALVLSVILYRKLGRDGEK